MDDLIEDEDRDFNEPEEGDEAIGSVDKTQTRAAEIDPDLNRKAEEKERKRWQIEAVDEQLREASLRAWEKERLADAEGREGRLVPLVKPDPFVAEKPHVPRMAKPKEKTAARYEPCNDVLDDAETELTAVIAECRYFMREMAFESARLTPDARDRLSFIESARKLAETSAAVGKSIAPLRNPALIEPEEKKRARR
jgi:hypothetical protein